MSRETIIRDTLVRSLEGELWYAALIGERLRARKGPLSAGQRVGLTWSGNMRPRVQRSGGRLSLGLPHRRPWMHPFSPSFHPSPSISSSLFLCPLLLVYLPDLSLSLSSSYSLCLKEQTQASRSLPLLYRLFSIFPLLFLVYPVFLSMPSAHAIFLFKIFPSF